MAIVSSTVVAGPLQKDGRRYVTETHTDGVGGKHVRMYLAAAGADHQAIANARAPLIAEEIAQEEFMMILARDGAIVPKHQTLDQLVQRLRVYFRSSERFECARVARWLVVHLEGGHIMDTPARTAFGMTLVEWTAFRTKMDVLRGNYSAVDSARGE